MTDFLPILSTLLGGINLLFLLKLIFNDLRHLSDKLDRHLDFSEQLHREQERRLSILESRPSDDR